MNYGQYRPGGFNVLPLVVKNLLIINVLFFLGTFAVGRAFNVDLTDFFGLHYVLSDKFNPFQFITYMFMHGGLGHIFFNMFALWMFGNVLENVWGPKRFLTFYLVTGIGAALIQMLILWWKFSSIQTAVDLYASSPSPEQFTAIIKDSFPFYADQLSGFVNEWILTPADPKYIQDSLEYINDLIKFRMDIPTVGASGAIFGILMAFGLMFPNSLLYIYFAIPIKAKYFVMLYGGLELYMGIANNPGDNVAHFAHLGGMVFGFAMMKYWNKRPRRGT